MENNKTHIAIVLAGGRGSRMNSTVPKQYMLLADRPVLYYSLKCMEESFIDYIILVCGQGDEDYCQSEIVDKYGFNKVVSITAGGEQRYDSVYNGLKQIDCLGIAEDSSYVYIHDGARPCIDIPLLEACRDSAVSYGATVPAVPVKDTIKVIDNEGFCVATPERSSLMAVQTPQCFFFETAWLAYSRMKRAALDGADISGITDDAMVVEQYTKTRVKLCEGSYNNIKITTPEDLFIAAGILEKRRSNELCKNAKCKKNL